MANSPSMFMKLNVLGMWVALITLIILWLSASVLAQGAAPAPGSSPPPARQRTVRCRLRQYGACYQLWHLCPSICPRTCLVDCVTCRPICSCDYPGAVCQDPRFVGGDGNVFYFHGHKDQDFCLVSDANLHINAHFIGKRNGTMKRDFTWVQSIALIFSTHNLLIAAKTTSKWDENIDRLDLSFNGKPFSLPTNEGSSWQFPAAAPADVSVTRIRDTNAVMVEVAGNFRVTAAVVPIDEEESRVHGYNITDENCFAHLELGFKFYNLSDTVDGVLGQTYRKNYETKAKIGVPMPVLGGSEKFLSSNIFATNCLVSRFGQNVDFEDNKGEYTSLSCNSGVKGTGLVCRR